ncbi:MAG: hypothetical protein CMF31_07185 [Kordiimonas sp.]|nr:hypothetical protein [Kordiimonas sp.]
MRILGSLFVLIFLVAIAAIAVANRHEVIFSLSPLPFDITLPVYLLIFIGLFLGLIAGGFVSVMARWRYRRLLRRQDKDIKRLEKQLQTLPTPTDHDKTTARLSA